MIPPRPQDIKRLPANGIADMGDVTSDTSVCRFGLQGVERWGLAWIYGKASGGTGSATMTLKLDHNSENPNFDMTILEQTAFGTDGTAEFFIRIPDCELRAYTYPADETAVAEWTNPDSGTMQWALLVGVYDATE